MKRLAFLAIMFAAVAPLLFGGVSIGEAVAPAAIVFASDRDDDFFDIYSMAADGSNVTRLTNDPAFDEHPTWSPDGTQIVFDSRRGGPRQIWVMDADGGNVLRVSAEDVFGSFPAWSPDGSRIAYLGADESGQNIDVYVMDLDGSNVERLTDDPAWDGLPAWSPNGSLIAFVSERDGNREIYVMNADGSNETNITNYPGRDDEPDWPPGYGPIIFGREGELFEVGFEVGYAYVNNVTRTEDEIESDPAWSADGNKVAYVTTRDGNPEIYVHPFFFRYGPVADDRLTDNPAADVSPDWRRGAYAGPGDVSCNGVIDVVDSALILQLNARLFEFLACPQNADVNVDGLVNSVDSLLILQYDAGLINSLPP